MLLLSLGLGAVTDFVGRAPSDVSIAFVPTAGDPYDDPEFVGRDRKALRALGFEVTDLDLKGQTPSRLTAALAEADVLFVAGGNTFYLLQHIRQSGFDQVLPEALDRGLIYVGASAGAIVVGPDVEPVVELDDPAAAPGLDGYAGLGLVDFVVLPHYGNEKYLPTYEGILDRYRDRYRLITLRDDEALLVEDGKPPEVVASP